MIAAVRWIICLPVSFLSTVAAWIVAPICPWFAHDFSLRGTWLWWATTPQTDLRGDPDHRERWHDKSSYLQQVTWVLRNPGVNFQREVLGVHVAFDDLIVTKGDPEVRDFGGHYSQFIKRDGVTIAWMFFGIWPYPFAKGKALRVLLGWKTWDAHVKDPLQITCRITLWKSFVPKEKK